MAYACTNSKGDQYFLHGKTVTLQNGRPIPVYYFRRDQKPHEMLETLPEGYVIEEKGRTGLPYLKRAAS